MDYTDVDLRLEAIEQHLAKISTQIETFNALPHKIPKFMQEQFNLLLSVLDTNKEDPQYEYIVRMLGGLAYCQAEIIENQRQIIKLFGGKNIQMKGISVEEKQRRGEAALNELYDPLKGVLK